MNLPTATNFAPTSQCAWRSALVPFAPFLAAALLFVTAPPGSAQEVLQENAIDDGAFDHPAISYSHFKALDVVAADFDGNGVKDLVVGGQNGYDFQAFSLQVVYMKLDQGEVVVDHIQKLNCVNNCIYDPIHPQDTDPIYALDVADIDGVNGPDIVASIFQNNSLDHIYLNTGSSGNNFSQVTTVPKPPGLGATGDLELDDIDGDGKVDLVSAGNYGVHYYRGNGDGTFQYKTTYLATEGARGLDIGDVDGDGDEDAVAAGGNDVVVKVLRNRRRPHLQDPPGYTDDPFVVVNQAATLTANFKPEWKTPQVSATCSAGTEYLGPTIIGTFSCDLADFDGDGDLDVVVANSYAQNVLYLNYGVGNGTGYFGSKNVDPTPLSHSDADGIAAIVFPTLTPDWTGSSAALDVLYYTPPEPAQSCGTSAVVYHLPGKRIEMTTGVEAVDLNGDNRLDIAFSNRNDGEDLMYAAAPNLPDYTFPPDTYDYVFFNNSYYDANGKYIWPFDCVERVGDPDDGTAYAQFANMNPATMDTGDSRPDWLDANWENTTPANGGVQHVFFGNRLVSRSWPALTQIPNPVPFDLDLSLSNSDVGKTYVLFVSCNGASSPPTQYQGFSVPLANAAAVAGFSGTVGSPNLHLAGTVSVAALPSPCSAVPCELFFTVYLISGTTGKATNITRIPVKCQ